jgi:hypothetical protein
MIPTGTIHTLEYALRHHNLRHIVRIYLERDVRELAFEIKSAERVSSLDTRHLRGLGELLDKPLLHSFVLSDDTEAMSFTQDITAIHAAYFLGMIFFTLLQKLSG